MKRVTYKDYAGVSLKGDVELGPHGPRHIDGASWLTAQVESGGKFGTVISYDGTGLTAGIHQAIAVYPRELESPDDGYAKDDQGPLWKLLHRCFQAYPETQLVKDMKDFLVKYGIVVVNGVARDADTHKILTGLYLRQVLTGSSDGVMPDSGPGRKRAEYAAGMFSVFFSSMLTQHIQMAWGEEHLIKRVERTKMRFLKHTTRKGRTIQQLIYDNVNNGIEVSLALSKDIPASFDLAMSVWLSFTVNAPSIALRRMCRTFQSYGISDVDVFSSELIRSLGKSRWGRWSDDYRYGRYQRTRNYAMKVWPKELFEGKHAVMPKEL